MDEAYFNPASASFSIQRYTAQTASALTDQLAVEEPLEIRVAFGGERKEGVSLVGGERVINAIAVTMRTPTAGGGKGWCRRILSWRWGFCFRRGLFGRRGRWSGVFIVGRRRGAGGMRLHNVVRVELRAGVTADMARLERHFFTHSSCGVCGKTTIEALRTLRVGAVVGDFVVGAELLHAFAGVFAGGAGGV